MSYACRLTGFVSLKEWVTAQHVIDAFGEDILKDIRDETPGFKSEKDLFFKASDMHDVELHLDKEKSFLEFDINLRHANDDFFWWTKEMSNRIGMISDEPGEIELTNEDSGDRDNSTIFIFGESPIVIAEYKRDQDVNEAMFLLGKHLSSDQLKSTELFVRGLLAEHEDKPAELPAPSI